MILNNSFHNTEVQVRAEPGQILSAAQVRKVRKSLCGQKSCRCGGALHADGNQVEITFVDGREAYMIAEN